MLFGRYEHNLDAKGRIFVPVKLRDKLGSSFIAATVLDSCVTLYSIEEWDKLIEKISQEPMTKARRLVRHLSANAQEVEVDAQGRILLPKHLIERAGLTKEATVIGAGNRAEIWDRKTFEELDKQMTDEVVESDFIELGF